MIYICDFFTRNIEAVSNQIELLAINTNSSIVSATRFMKQRALRRKDLKDKIFIFSPYIYEILLPLILLTSKSPVHYFEEEPSTWRRIIFNISRRPLYISMYRRPDQTYAEHIKKYKNLKIIFVELDYHKELLVNNGIDKSVVHVSQTPAKLCRKENMKTFNKDNISILFASWNNKEKNALQERGLIYLLDLLKINKNFNLKIPLRDNDTKEFLEIAKEKGVIDRVSLLNISNIDELIELFSESDLVSYMAQNRIVKDVPNSLLDGISLGKPILITDIIDFSKIVKENNLGIVIKTGEKAKKIDISSADYCKMSNNAYEYSIKHTDKEYLSIIDFYEFK
ncbi:MAG: glycosyltransferase [Candidatus Saccharibacteria bacterium]